MRTLKKSAAFVAMLAFLISALVPVSALAVSPGDTAPTENISTELADSARTINTTAASAQAAGVSGAREEVKPGLDISEDGMDATMSGQLSADGQRLEMSMLVNVANHQITLDAGEVPEKPLDHSEGAEPGTVRSGDWKITWTVTPPEGGEYPSVASNETTKMAGIRSDRLNVVGQWTFTCTATWQDAPGNEDPTPVNPASVEFVINTLGMGLMRDGESASNSRIIIDAETLETGEGVGVAYPDYPFEAILRVPTGGTALEYPQSAIDFGPTHITIDRFEWTTNRTHLGNWKVETDRAPSTVIYNEDRAEQGTSSVNPELSGANFTAGEAEYYCRAYGVGVDSSEDGVATFTVEVTPFLEAVIDRSGAPSGTFSEGELIANDPTRVALKYNYAPNSTVPLRVQWRNGIDAEDAKFVWTQEDAGSTRVVQDSSLTNPPSGPMVYRYQLAVTAEPVDFYCTVTSPYLLTTRTMRTEHQVSVFTDIAPPTVVLQRVTKGTPTPLLGDTLDLMSGMDVAFHAQVQGSGTESDRGDFKYDWQLRKANGEVIALRNETTADLKLTNITSKENNGDTYTVTVTYRQSGYSATASITLIVDETPLSPEVTSNSTPDNNGGRITQKEKKPVVMRAEVTNDVTPKALKFQWEELNADGQWVAAKGGTAKLDSTGMISEYTIASPTIKDHNEKQYRCAVTTKVDSLESPATMTRPVFELQILPQTGVVSFTEPTEDQTYELESGQGRELKVKAETDQGQAPVYQWYVATAASSSAIGDQELGQEIAGATKESYTTGRLAAGFYKFTCRATNKSDAELYADRVFRINVTQSPTQPIVKVKGDLKVGAMVGDTVTFEVEAHTVSGDPVTYRWQRRNGDRGTWTDVTGGSRRMLTVRDVKTTDNNANYRCVVTNANASDQYFESDIIVLSVWRPEDVPVIVENPKDVRILAGSQGANISTLEVVAETTGKDPYQFEWYYRPNEEADWTPTELQWDEIVEGENRARAVLHLSESSDIVGEYYCTVTNPGGNPAGATAKSDIARVDVMIRHTPLITSQPASVIYTNVGKTATLRVVADIAPEEPLIYTWQISPDGGQSWRNCTSADGDGYNTDTFTTMTVTQQMVGYTLFYRCEVTGQENRVVARTSTTQVVPKRPSPEVKTINQTFLTVEVDPRTGERFLTGHTAGTPEHAMTPVEIRRALDLSDVQDGSIEFTRNGRAVKDTDAVGTGVVVTLLDKNGVPLDDVTVVVKGDVMGTGVSTLSQLTTMAKARNGKVTMSTPYKRASDHNNNGQYFELSDIVAQAKLYKQGGGENPATPTPDASASPTRGR